MKLNRRTAYVVSLNRTIIILFVLMIPTYVVAVAEPPTASEWQLSETKVVSWGTLATVSEGRVRTGITIEGKATAQDQAAGEGLFSATLTAFAPSEDMPGQKKGFWYLKGNWTIAAKETVEATRASRGNPILSGVLKAVLPFDPTVGTGVMEADVRLQQRGISPRAWRMAMGSFSGTTHLEGRLTVPAPPSTSTNGRKRQE